MRSADGVRNLHDIVAAENGKLFMIVSAMGKTTNALEKVAELFTEGDTRGAKESLAVSMEYHARICSELFGANGGHGAGGTEHGAAGGEKCTLPSGGGDCTYDMPPKVALMFEELTTLIETGGGRPEEYDLWYDRIVSYGELISTAIVSEYLTMRGLAAKWIDIRDCFVTDDRHRQATVDIGASAPLVLAAASNPDARLFISQGFIGADARGETTTLGREGSDYSAAVAANILDAESLTIWKDVEGILTADPKMFADAVYIPELTYLDAIELSYSGAQIIHPKTIKPLQNKHIPLFVRPFGEPSKPGSVIKDTTRKKIDQPILILKANQVLISIRPQDFSFVLEERFTEIFALLETCGIRINLIQSSAVNLSMSVDDSRRLPAVAAELRTRGFRVVFNGDMQLLTIRGYTQALYEKYGLGSDVYLMQKTRSTLRIVRCLPTHGDHDAR